ncbi:MAG: SAM-dependent methyltransferase, partial [Desulfomonilaceae bacterium]
MKVYFVGAGPGDPELLTIKADRLLRKSRIIVYAGSLVNTRILSLLPEGAEKHDSANLDLQDIK